jgi:hypothetical protein
MDVALSTALRSISSIPPEQPIPIPSSQPPAGTTQIRNPQFCSKENPHNYHQKRNPPQSSGNDNLAFNCVEFWQVDAAKTRFS